MVEFIDEALPHDLVRIVTHAVTISQHLDKPFALDKWHALFEHPVNDSKKCNTLGALRPYAVGDTSLHHQGQTVVKRWIASRCLYQRFLFERAI